MTADVKAQEEKQECTRFKTQAACQTSPAPCPICGLIAKMVSRGCRLVCGACGLFEFETDAG